MTEMRLDFDKPLTLEQLREMEGQPVYNWMGQQWYVIDEVFIKGNLKNGNCNYAQVTMSDGEIFCRDLDYDEISGRFYAYPPAQIDREAWDACVNCVDVESLAKRLKCCTSYCPACGRPLTEEAWDELEKRLRG